MRTKLQTGLLGYLIRDWRSLHFATTGLILPQILMWGLIPESPRWLAAEGKWKEFEEVLQWSLSTNQRHLSIDYRFPDSGTKTKSHGGTKVEVSVKTVKWSDMFVSPVLRTRYDLHAT